MNYSRREILRLTRGPAVGASSILTLKALALAVTPMPIPKKPGESVVRWSAHSLRSSDGG